MNELKPCPFCGGKASIYDNYETQFTRPYLSVSCRNCGAMVVDFDISHCLNDIVEAWNRRADNETD